eukprot:1187236-Prorocentrum_minimum.AAC.2
MPRDKLIKVLGVGEVKVKTEDEAVEAFPPTSIWGRAHEDPRSEPFASCAIVGNSPVLTKGGNTLGKEIDEHDLVMRFNNAPTKVPKRSQTSLFARG